MKRLCIAFCLFLIFAAHSVYAAAPPRENTVTTLKKASTFMTSISTNGGYVGIYSLDLKERFGEAVYEKAAANEIWVQPPGTPTIGQRYLRAWKATGDRFYLDAARDCGRALVWGQRQEGGWDHRVDVSKLTSSATEPERESGSGSFDDSITQGALTFLIELDGELNEKWLDDAIELGMAFMIESQFENGAWPQWYPLREGYHDYYTYNDNAINDNIHLMLKAHSVYGKSEYLATAEKGGEFILSSPVSESQPGWAQQYSHDMKPAWARAFEPPCVCSAVTSRNIRMLVELYHYTGDRKYLEPIPAAFHWLAGSKIGDNLWARMYEVGTNRPIYGDRDKKIHYTLEEISDERRNGYSWQSSYGLKGALDVFCKALASGPVKPSPLESLSLLPPEDRAERKAAMVDEVSEAIRSLDEKGRWVNEEDSRIYARDFVANAKLLLDYIEITQ